MGGVNVSVKEVARYQQESGPESLSRKMEGTNKRREKNEKLKGVESQFLKMLLREIHGIHCLEKPEAACKNQGLSVWRDAWIPFVTRCPC